ncbi:MAG: hypothetical protein AAF639_24315 [Chloroflexota bacterium]
MIETRLNQWIAAMDVALGWQESHAMTQLAQVVLLRSPKNLAVYERMIQAAWQLAQWQEGDEWARRLLQADPGNPVAWQMTARAEEALGNHARAYAIWQRAFAYQPYSSEMRQGLYRTVTSTQSEISSTEQIPTEQIPTEQVSAKPVTAGVLFRLDNMCLAQLYLQSHQWAKATQLYSQLIKQNPQRVDFQVSLMVSLWQRDTQQGSILIQDDIQNNEAYRWARHLVQRHQNLLAAWIVLDNIGDENDQALAKNPLESMDPTRQFMMDRFHITLAQNPVSIQVNEDELALLYAFSDGV